jgi:hypothetical protein
VCWIIKLTKLLFVLNYHYHFNNKQSKMLNYSKTIVFLAAVLVSILKDETSTAFAPSSSVSSKQSSACTTRTSLFAESPCSRRQALFGVAAAAFATVAATNPVEPAAAKYSDYSRREKDWQERQSKGEVKFSSAKDLRAQLQEIAPANSEGICFSFVFNVY